MHPGSAASCAERSNSLIAARSQQASHYVEGALLMLDDETLAEHGHDRKQLRKRGADLLSASEYRQNLQSPGRSHGAALFAVGPFATSRLQRVRCIVAQPSR